MFPGTLLAFHRTVTIPDPAVVDRCTVKTSIPCQSLCDRCRSQACRSGGFSVWSLSRNCSVGPSYSFWKRNSDLLYRIPHAGDW
jgi:hypothetical protein